MHLIQQRCLFDIKQYIILSITLGGEGAINFKFLLYFQSFLCGGIISKVFYYLPFFFLSFPNPTGISFAIRRAMLGRKKQALFRHWNILPYLQYFNKDLQLHHSKCLTSIDAASFFRSVNIINLDLVRILGDGIFASHQELQRTEDGKAGRFLSYLKDWKMWLWHQQWFIQG